MKRIISIILALAVLMSTTALLGGCGKEDVSSGKLTVWGSFNESDVSANVDEKTEAYHALWEKYTDKEIEWIRGHFEMTMASGDYPNVIMYGGGLETQTVAKYIAQGVLLPLDEYINEKDTPNIWKMFSEQPQAKAIATSPDGRIYALPRYYESKPSYLENVMYINKKWLDKLELEIPKTLDDLYNVLKAFKTQDPNGNGKADEVPMTFCNNHGYAYPETILAAWGISTKYGNKDGWLNVKDGKVYFSPMFDEWKEMCLFYNKLYKEGLLDIECFTQNTQQLMSKLSSDTPTVGFTFFNNDSAFGTSRDEYIPIAPISADGKIKPVYRIHPGYMGQKGCAYVTSTCDDPKAAVMFLDHFYDPENTIINWYGRVGEDDTFTMKDGIYTWNTPAEGETHIELYTKNSIYGPSILGYLPGDVIGTKLQEGDFMGTGKELYELYKPYLDEEVWPRPYYSTEDATRINELITDLTTYVEQMKANFISGKLDVSDDAEWNAYIKNLKKLGADEFLEINQRAYDVFTKALESVK